MNGKRKRTRNRKEYSGEETERCNTKVENINGILWLVEYVEPNTLN
jgi:hypothetical protein